MCSSSFVVFEMPFGLCNFSVSWSCCAKNLRPYPFNDLPWLLISVGLLLWDIFWALLVGINIDMLFCFLCDSAFTFLMMATFNIGILLIEKLN